MDSIYQRARPALLLLLGGTIGIGLTLSSLGCFLDPCFWNAPPVDDPGEVAAVQFPYQSHEFDHETHKASLSCTSCHHAGAGTAVCSVCHADEWLDGVAKLKEAKHQTCRACHDAMAGGRARCDTCHTGLNMLVAAEIDTDGDGVLDVNDNCRNTANPDQADFDGDGIGDVCDPCPFNVNQIATAGDGTDTGDGDGTDTGDGDGTAPDGSALYSANCASCHGADGASGFAPDVTGGSAAALTTGLESASHGSISLTAEEIAAIATFLGG